MQSADASSVSTAVLPSSSSRVQLVGVGDSLTQRAQQPDGWLTLLAHYYQRRMDAINRGFSGYNSDWLLALITQQRSAAAHHSVWRLSEQHTARALYIVGIGANDAVLPPVALNKQHVPLQRYQSNVHTQRSATRHDTRSRARVLGRLCCVCCSQLSSPARVSARPLSVVFVCAGG